MKLPIFLIALVLIIVPVSAAVQDLGEFTTGNCVTLKQTCANCTFVNVTSVIYPNSSQALGETEMTASGTEYSYEFCNTIPIGQYIYNTLGDPNGVRTVEPVSFDIKAGYSTENTLTTFLVLTLLSFTLLVLSFLFSNYLMAFFAGLSLSSAGVYTMIYGFGNITTNFTRITSFIILGLGLVITIVSSLEVLKEMSGGDSSYIPEEED